MPYLYFHRRGQELLHLDLAEQMSPEKPLVVGSKRGTYVVPDAGIAPAQFMIEQQGEEYRLTDLSGEGTEVDEKRVETTLLRDCAFIKLGGFAVYFQRGLLQPYDSSGRRTLADAFTPPELPRALWVTAKHKDGRAPLRVDFTDKALIGSGKGCTLQVTGDSVSSRHVELAREGGVVRLRDLGSTNGTWLGPVKVIDVDLPLGMRFRVGDWEVFLSGADDPRAKAPRPVATVGGLVTNDPTMLALLQQADAISNSDCPVLILGETGTGKELLAKAIHERSRRANKKLVNFNCGTGRSSENLATQLFGHTDHAFTGASKAEPGTLGAADGGTVFLDELKALRLALQPTLLRAVGEGEIHPLGAPEPRHVDVRYIAATHHDLVEAIRAGDFREDLYWRFAVVKLTLPPLRHRKGDILILWDHFVDKLWGGRVPMKLTDAAQKKLLDHDWPGNVRELWNLVNRVLLFNPGTVCDADAIVFDEVITPRPSGDSPTPAPSAPVPAGAVEIVGKTWSQLEAAALAIVMVHVKGNRTEAARQLDIDYKTLLRKLKEHGLEGVGV